MVSKREDFFFLVSLQAQHSPRSRCKLFLFSPVQSVSDTCSLCQECMPQFNTCNDFIPDLARLPAVCLAPPRAGSRPRRRSSRHRAGCARRAPRQGSTYPRHPFKLQNEGGKSGLRHRLDAKKGLTQWFCHCKWPLQTVLSPKVSHTPSRLQ